MRVNIQSLHFDASQRLITFIEEKSNRLPRYFDHITDIQVTLKLDKNKTTGSKYVEMKLLVPQSVIVATENGKSFEEAFDICLDSVSRQLTRYKEKLRTPSQKEALALLGNNVAEFAELAEA
jgi:putative sigma-54 modulation protein